MYTSVMLNVSSLCIYYLLSGFKLRWLIHVKHNLLKISVVWNIWVQITLEMCFLFQYFPSDRNIHIITEKQIRKKMALTLNIKVSRMSMIRRHSFWSSCEILTLNCHILRTLSIASTKKSLLTRLYCLAHLLKGSWSKAKSYQFSSISHTVHVGMTWLILCSGHR